MLSVGIEDSTSKTKAKVTEESAVLVTQSVNVPVEKSITSVPFTVKFTVNNDGVTNNLNSIGSLASPIDAYISGFGEGDFYITTLNMLISDNANSLLLNRFGGQPKLINGIQFIYSIEEKEIVLNTSVTNFDLIRLGTLTQPIGTKNDAFQINGTTVDNEDSYNPVFDLTRLSPYGMGIKIRKDSLDKLIFRVRDDLSLVNSIYIECFGYIRIIKDKEHE